MSTRINLPFPARYEFDVLLRVPLESTEQRFNFPQHMHGSNSGDLVVKVVPQDGPTWLGIFARDYESPNAVTGVYTCPDENSICVISGGKGYVVNAPNPGSWEQISTYPILEVLALVDKNLILFADFTIISAYGPQGHVWTTSQLSWDGLKIIETTPDYVKGLAWDAPGEQEVEFVIESDTGKHTGGSSPTSL